MNRIHFRPVLPTIKRPQLTELHRVYSSSIRLKKKCGCTKKKKKGKESSKRENDCVYYMMFLLYVLYIVYGIAQHFGFIVYAIFNDEIAYSLIGPQVVQLPAAYIQATYSTLCIFVGLYCCIVCYLSTISCKLKARD